MHVFGQWKELEYRGWTHSYTWKTCKLHTEKPQPGFKPGTLLLWGDGASIWVFFCLFVCFFPSSFKWHSPIIMTCLCSYIYKWRFLLQRHLRGQSLLNSFDIMPVELCDRLATCPKCTPPSGPMAAGMGWSPPLQPWIGLIGMENR